MIALDEILNLLKQHSFECDSSELQLERVACCDVGDNFCGNVYKIKLMKRINNEFHSSLVIKEKLSHHIQSRIAFDNERYAYTEIIPLLEHQIKGDLPISKLIGASDKCLLLTDLSQAGLICLTRRNDFNPDEAKLVLKNLSHLHASSILLKHNNNSAFEQIASHIINYKFQSGSYLQSYQEVHLTVAIKILQRTKRNKRVSKAIDVLNGLRNRTYEMQKLLFEVRRETDVITHGDLWSNNIMHDKAENAIKLIDLQLMICTSPAADLSYFLYNCLSVNTIRSHYDDLLSDYLAELQRSLEVNGIDHLPYDSDWLMAEMDRFRLYGFLSALWMLPVFYYDRERFRSDVVDDLNENYLLDNVTPDYEARMIDLILHFVADFGGCAGP